MSYEVIIDISDVERRSFDFKRMFDKSIPCKQRIVRCRDCKWFLVDERYDNACRWFCRSLKDDNGFCAWGERKSE